MSLNDVDFTGQMQQGRDLAQRARNRGESARSRGKWAKAPPAPDTPENRLYADMADMQRELRDARNTIAVLQQGGDPNDFGAEFDRLFTAGKAERQGLPPLPSLSPCRSTTPERTRGPRTMTTRQYLAALKKLGLSPASQVTAYMLGLSVRQCQRLAAGQPVPEPISRLLDAYLAHGLPPDEPDEP